MMPTMGVTFDIIVIVIAVGDYGYGQSCEDEDHSVCGVELRVGTVARMKIFVVMLEGDGPCACRASCAADKHKH